jgi:hypothetical protein
MTQTATQHRQETKGQWETKDGIIATTEWTTLVLVPLLHQDRLLSAKVPSAVTLTNGCGPTTGGPNPTVYIYVALTHQQALYIQSPQHSPYHEVSGKSRTDNRSGAIWRWAERDAYLRDMFTAVHYSIGLNVHSLQIKIYCHKANHTTDIITLHTVM